jgi:hypothetical protein
MSTEPITPASEVQAAVLEEFQHMATILMFAHFCNMVAPDAPSAAAQAILQSHRERVTAYVKRAGEDTSDEMAEEWAKYSGEIDAALNWLDSTVMEAVNLFPFEAAFVKADTTPDTSSHNQPTT